MIRDPFNVRHKNVFKATAFAHRAAQNFAETATKVGTEAIDSMAFSMPRNLPDFGNPERSMEDRAWASIPGRNVVSSFMGKEELPMYKDKPMGYPGSQRLRPWYKRKRSIGLLGALLFLLFWWTGYFSNEAETRKPASGWSWMKLTSKNEPNWDDRREKVVEAFQLSWDSYERYAWGYDEYHPISKTGKYMAPSGLGWIIVDALDTLIIMNQTERLQHAREWVSKKLTWDQDQDVNTFETTIRMLGGLLGAHYLSTEFPELAPLTEDDLGQPGEDLYLETAKDLGDRLLSAFESASGIPYASVNLEKFLGIPSHEDMGASSTAEATSVQLELKYLAHLTGEKYFWDKAEKVMEVVDDNNPKAGLVPIYIYATSGEFRGENIRLGSRGDSYYEYLIKQYLQTNKQEPVYQEMWYESMAGMREHLLTYTHPSGFTILGERPNGLKGDLSPKMDHLVCFLPGTIALAVTGGLTEAEARKLPTWSQRDEDDMKLARELMHTCWGMYKYMATGLAAEITYFSITDPPPPASAAHNPPADFDADPEATWRKDFKVKPNDKHNLQRPETVESLFYMWRITGDSKYREWGWEMFSSFMEHTAVEERGGFTSLSNADVVPPKTRDNMESFWLVSASSYSGHVITTAAANCSLTTNLGGNAQVYVPPLFAQRPLAAR